MQTTFFDLEFEDSVTGQLTADLHIKPSAIYGDKGTPTHNRLPIKSHPIIGAPAPSTSELNALIDSLIRELEYLRYVGIKGFQK